MKRPLLTVLCVFLWGELAGWLMEKRIWYPIGALAALAGIIWRSSRRIANKKKRYSMLLLFLFVLGLAWSYGVRQHATALQERIAEAEQRGEEIPVEGIISEKKAKSFILNSEEGKLRVLTGWKAQKGWAEQTGQAGQAGQTGQAGQAGQTDQAGQAGQTGPAGQTEQAEEVGREGQTEPAGQVGVAELSDDPEVGDRVRVSGVPERIPSSTNPGGFDSGEYYESEGVLWQLRSEQVQILEKNADTMTAFLGRIRKNCCERLQQILPEKEAGVLSAMLLGERTGMDEELKELYRRNGIAHILAISGLHVSLIGAGLMALLAFLGLSRRKASLIVIIFLFFYGLLTGFAPATARAVWMLTAVNLAFLFRRTGDLPTATGGSLFLILVQNPYRITSAGTLMSFLSAVGVIANGELFRAIFGHERFLSIPSRLRSPVKRLTGMLLFGITLQCFLQPVLLRDYYEMTPYSIFLNLLVIPLLTVAVCSGVAGLLISLIPGCIPVAEVAALPCKWILQFYEWLCRLMLRVPGHEVVTGHITTGEMLLILLIISAVMVLLVCRLRGRRRKDRIWRSYLFVIAALLGLLTAAGGYAMLRNRTEGQVTFLDVGQGDGCLIHTRGGADLLVDCGSSSEEDVGDDVLVPALRYYGITELDGIFVSHTDSDHIGGIITLLQEREESGISVRCLYLAAGTLWDEGLEHLLAAAEQAGTAVEYLAEGNVAELSDVCAEILLPLRGTEGEGNEHSLVLLLKASGCEILFTGDIGAETEKELVSVMEERRITPEILKVPHHGSRYSSSELLLRYEGWSAAEGAERPAAVISCGKRNLYGHPAKETLERLEEAGFTVYRTDRQGAVVLELP